MMSMLMMIHHTYACEQTMMKAAKSNDAGGVGNDGRRKSDGVRIPTLYYSSFSFSQQIQTAR